MPTLIDPHLCLSMRYLCIMNLSGCSYGTSDLRIPVSGGSQRPALNKAIDRAGDVDVSRESGFFGLYWTRATLSSSPKEETMKIRLVVILLGSVISFALPVCAQQTNRHSHNYVGRLSRSLKKLATHLTIAMPPHSVRSAERTGFW
jgi:hypothetical protein